MAAFVQTSEGKAANEFNHRDW